LQTLEKSNKLFIILFTNDVDVKNYPHNQMLHEYKEQQKVEGGFKFLKGLWFTVDLFF
jgi:transposase